MKLTVTSLLILLLLAPASALAADARLDSVRVTGIELPSADILGKLLSRSGGILNDGLVEHDRDFLAGYLREQGWWNATVEAAVDSSAGIRVLTFRTTPGHRVYFGRLEVRTETPVTGFEQREYPSIAGKPFTRQELEGIIGDFFSRLAVQGYPGAEIVPQLSARGDTVDVRLAFTAGSRAHVDSVAIRGLKVTKDRVIRRELGDLPGQAVSPDVVSSARTAIGRLRFVRLAGDPVVEYTEQGRAILAIPLEEGTRGSFDGALGYQPASGSGSGEIVGKVDLSMENLFGTGRALALRWENLGKNTEDMKLTYSEPWALGLPVSLEGSFAQERRDSQGYTQTLFTAGAGRDLGRLHASAGMRHERTSSDSLASAAATGVEAGASWNALDNSANPRSGIRYSGSWSSLRKRYLFGSRERSTLTRTEISMDNYIPTAHNQTIAILLSYRRVDAGNRVIDSADRFWIGGASSLRGYREQVFPSDRALLSTLEYRFLTGGTSRVFVFTDIGHLWNRTLSGERITTSTLTRIGYGFGLRIQSRAGTLGFDYGLGNRRRAPATANSMCG